MPTELTSIVGRASLLERLIEVLGTTWAPPGQLADRYSDGARFLDLAPLSGAGVADQAVASNLGVSARRGLPLVDSVAEELNCAQLLLVLDIRPNIRILCTFNRISEVMIALGRLVSKSLVQVERRDNQVRHRLLETVRDFIKLGAIGTGIVATGGMGQMVALARRAPPQLAIPTMDRLVLTTVVDIVYDAILVGPHFGSVDIQRLPLRTTPPAPEAHPGDLVPDVFQGEIATAYNDSLKQINPDYFIPMHCTGFFTEALIDHVMPERLIEPSSGTRVVFGA